MHCTLLDAPVLQVVAPRGHWVHSCCPNLSEYVPKPHSMHSAWSWASLDSPSAQALQKYNPSLWVPARQVTGVGLTGRITVPPGKMKVLADANVGAVVGVIVVGVVVGAVVLVGAVVFDLRPLSGLPLRVVV